MNATRRSLDLSLLSLSHPGWLILPKKAKFYLDGLRSELIGSLPM
jgi:hypothetical protein